MVLQLRQISFSYDPPSQRFGGPHSPSRGFTLRDVSLTVERGSLTGLLGPNGWGKTTLLRLMAGVLRPQQGTMAFDGRALAEIPRRELARHIAVVPQETHPAFDYSVLEMVLMGRHPHLRTFELEGPDDLAIAYDALGATGTAHLAARSYMSLRSASSLPARSRSSPTCCCSTSRLPHSISRTSSRWRHSSAG